MITAQRDKRGWGSNGSIHRSLVDGITATHSLGAHRHTTLLR